MIKALAFTMFVYTLPTVPATVIEFKTLELCVAGLQAIHEKYPVAECSTPEGVRIKLSDIVSRK